MSLGGPTAVVLDSIVFGDQLWEVDDDGTVAPVYYRGLEACVSVASVADVIATAQIVHDATLVAGLISVLRRFRVIRATLPLAQRCADVLAWSRLNGHPLGEGENVAAAWIASTSLSEGAPLVTDRRTLFDGYPALNVLDP